MISQVDTNLIGCEQFPEGSSMREICEGKSDLPLRKVNAYMEIWGLPLFEGEAETVKRKVRNSPRKTREKKKRKHILRRILDRAMGTRQTGGCSGCGGSSTTLKPDGYGPGSKLMEAFAKYDAPHCQACENMAAKMDRWGADGCSKRLDEIVDDILPRAKRFLAEKRPWTHLAASIPVVGEAAVRIGLTRMVVDAIEKAELPPKKRRTPRRQRRNRSRKNRRHLPTDKSNLIRSTAIGQPTWTLGDYAEVRRMPFTREPTRNLIYHVWPAKCDDVWRWNLDLLLEHIDLFNGRRIVAIAVDKDSDDAEDVEDHLAGEVMEFLVYRNNPDAGEMVSFLPLLAQVESHDPNEVTFRAHAKGTMRICAERDKPHIRGWIEACYLANLTDWPLVRQQLEESAITGAFRKFDMFRKAKRLPVYSGSFYWFRNCYVFSRDWYRVDNPRWGCESWPSKHFTESETRCLFNDETGSMYSRRYWEDTVQPAYESWLSERGVTC